LDNAKTHEIHVAIDLASGQITMQAGEATVTATLDQRPAQISYVGYAVTSAATDFSTVDISTNR
jgi:uncharacterized protein YggE